MSIKILFFVLSFSVVSLPLGVAKACLCEPWPIPLIVALEQADVVVMGTILRSEAPGFRPRIVGSDTTMIIRGGDMVRWEVKLDRIWKGAERDTIVIYSARLGDSCGVRFEIGKRYIIFASYRNATQEFAHRLWADSTEFPAAVASRCGGTREYNWIPDDVPGFPDPIWESSQ